MGLLLDSNILVAIIGGRISRLPAIASLIETPGNSMVVSIASLWEMTIKFHLGKLALQRRPETLPIYFRALGYQLLNIDHRHAVEELRNPPATRDPFDRMLLVQCQVEGLRLVTLDHVLAAHPLAWRP